MKKKGLGRGLSALLDDPAAEVTVRNEVTAAPRATGSVTMLGINRRGRAHL